MRDPETVPKKKRQRLCLETEEKSTTNGKNDHKMEVVAHENNANIETKSS